VFTECFPHIIRFKFRGFFFKILLRKAVGPTNQFPFRMERSLSGCGSASLPFHQFPFRRETNPFRLEISLSAWKVFYFAGPFSFRNKSSLSDIHPNHSVRVTFIYFLKRLLPAK
jgi:hypothetical protein